MELVSENTINDVRFFGAGNAVFTVFNNKGDRYTYKIRKKDLEEGRTIYFVSLMNGPDNYSSYNYLGLYDTTQNRVIITGKSNYKADSLPVKVLKWVLQTVKNQNKIPQGYGIIHEGKCCKCGRRLTTHESIEKGIGPECEKMFA